MAILHYALNAFIPLLLAGLGWWISRRARRLGTVAAATLLALILARPLLIHSPTIEQRLFPWLDYLYYYGWQFYLFPAFAVVLAGGITARRQRRMLLVLAALLYALNLLQVSWILRGQELRLQDRRDPEGFCLQSRPYTCGAASAVNLLTLYGIASSETEMAHLGLLVEGRGVHDLGVLRALRIKCAELPCDIVLASLDYDDLVALDSPAMIPLRLSFLTNHMVCVLDARPDEVEILDPLTGRQLMPRSDFEARFLGRAIYLSPR